MVPPLVDVAEVIELSALVVEAVGDLVADYDADAAVVQRLREVLVVERRLQYPRGEHLKGEIIVVRQVSQPSITNVTISL